VRRRSEAYLDAGQQGVDFGGLEVAEDRALDGETTRGQNATVLSFQCQGMCEWGEDALVGEREEKELKVCEEWSVF
jgi:hypothetical protein